MNSPRLSAHGEPIARSIPLVGVRKLMATHMTKTHLAVPAVTILEEWDVGPFCDLKTRLTTGDESGSLGNLSYTHLMIKAIAQALRLHSFLNATITDEEIQLLANINIGVAVALPDDSLVVPVIRNADLKGIEQIAAEVTSLVDRARRGALRVNEVRGGTFTLTNIGMVSDARWQTPLVNSAQAAILAVGAIREAPVVRNGAIVIGKVMSASLTFDHRIVSGVPANRFLRAIAALLDGSVHLALQPSE